MYDPTVGRFLSEDPLGFLGDDPNLSRYVGNSPTNATDPTGLQAKTPQEILEAIEKAQKNAGATTGTDTKPKGPVTGEIPLTNNKGDKITAAIIDIEGGTVTIQKQGEKPVPYPIANLSKEDQELMKKLAVVPPNIVIDPFGKKGEEAKDFVKTVANVIGKLNTIPKGKEIIQDIKNVVDPPPVKIGKAGVATQEGNETPIKIIPSTEVVDGKPDSKTTIKANDKTGQLESKVPPIVHFNPKSGFAGLGKELWHALKQIQGAIIPSSDGTFDPVQDVKNWDYNAIAIKSTLEDQYKP